MFDEIGDRKLCIICSKGSLDMAYPGLVLANAALMEGIDVTMFFTWMPNGMGIPNVMAVLPGMTGFASSMMKKEIEKLDFPPVREYLETIHDAGGKMYGCKMSMDMMKLTKDDLYEGVDAVVGAMEFMEMSEDAQVLFI
jgi:peroxiredoxin family protein